VDPLFHCYAIWTLFNVWSNIHVFCVFCMKRCRSQWHELSSLAWTLRSWVGITFRAWMFGVCVCVCAFTLYVGTGLAPGWSHVQGVLPTVYRLEKLKKRPRAKKGCRTIIIISISIYLFTCKLNSLQANYKVSMRKKNVQKKRKQNNVNRHNKNNTGNNSFINTNKSEKLIIYIYK
jgi:hypothetical protein